MNLQTDITEFFLGERRPMNRHELIAAIMQAASHNPAWATATEKQWNAALEQAIASGKLRLVGDTVWPVNVVEKKNTQGELF